MSQKNLSMNRIFTIKVGGFPSAVAVNPNTNMVYVVNRDSQTVSVINGSNNRVISNIPIDGAYDLAINPNLNKIYVIDSNGSKIDVIDGITNRNITKTISFSKPENISSPFPPIRPAITVDSKTNMVYATNSVGIGGSNLVLIDGSTNKVVKSSSLNNISSCNSLLFCIMHMAMDKDTNLIYITAEWENSVHIIDGKTMEEKSNISIGYPSTSLAVNPDSNKIYGATGDGNRVFVLNGSSNTFTTMVTANVSDPSGGSIAVDNVRNIVYTTNTGSNMLNTLNLVTGKISHIKAGKNSPSPLIFSSVTVNPNTNMIYVANSGSNTITVSDGQNNKEVSDIPVNGSLSSIFINSKTNRI